jgi:hypothetical protein
MNHALWITKKNQVCVLIKKISDMYGGDDVEELREYCREIVEVNRDDIQKALDCFWDVESRLKYYPRMEVPRGTMAKET